MAASSSPCEVAAHANLKSRVLDKTAEKKQWPACSLLWPVAGTKWWWAIPAAWGLTLELTSTRADPTQQNHRLKFTSTRADPLSKTIIWRWSSLPPELIQSVKPSSDTEVHFHQSWSHSVKPLSDTGADFHHSWPRSAKQSKLKELEVHVIT